MNRGCIVTGCDRPHKGRGYCKFHLDRLRRGYPLDAPPKNKLRELTPTCSVPGCDRPFASKGLCKPHYERLRTGLDVDRPVQRAWKMTPLARRMAEQTEVLDSGCHRWTGTLHPQGYGYVKTSGKTRRAHRVAYELAIGPIPDGLVLDHLCRNRWCVNPAHLEPVTQIENAMRGDGAAAVNARKTHCVRGHAFDEANTHWHGDGRRECRACARLRGYVIHSPSHNPHGLPRPNTD